MKYQKNKNTICTIRSCINPAKIKGFCKIHYSRFRRYGEIKRSKIPIVSKFSNLCKESKGHWQSPKYYVCKICGIKLNKKNTYKNAFKHHNYFCSKCQRKKTKLLYRNYRLNSGDGGILLRKKIPKHPKNNKCMLCLKPPTRRTGLCYHHWIIKNDIAYGIWLCNICHMFAERFDANFSVKYKEIKKNILKMVKK